MDALLEAPPRRPVNFADLAGISRQLSEDVGLLTPRRSGYTVADYLSLDGNYRVEYLDGCLQILPMPSGPHQDLIGELYTRVRAWARSSDPDGWTRMSPFRVMVTGTAYREPDVCFMLGRHAERRHNNYWDGADLVVEIISEGSRNHDEVTKRREYAVAGIPEYWLVDSDVRTVRVLTLPSAAADTYTVHGEFGLGQTATSVLLAGFAVDVAELFAATDPRA
jgi:Uma2 family endonuclease